MTPPDQLRGPLFIPIYVNDLNNAIKHCKVHHFAHDINSLYINDSIKKLNKVVNFDLKHLTNWLSANKISLNVSKTELTLFKPKMKNLDFNLKLKLNGKRLYPTKSVKYLGIKIDENLTWIDQDLGLILLLILTKLMLCYFKILKSIYYAIFDCHLNYANTIWG